MARRLPPHPADVTRRASSSTAAGPSARCCAPAGGRRSSSSCTDRALASEPWLAELKTPRPRVEPERTLTEIAHTRDHQGVVAWCEPYRYADAWELAAGERPLVACLDQVTDPHNLGAVCRTAEAAGRDGRRRPRAELGARHRRRLPRVGRRRRAPPGRRRREPLALPRRRRSAATSGRGPRTATRRRRVWEADLAGGVFLVFGSEGRGIRPGVRRACDDAFSIPLEGHVESLNVSVAAGVALFEAARQRRG